MNGKQPDDTDDPESIDTDEERSLSPLRHGAQLVKNPTRVAGPGITTLDQRADRTLVDVSGQYLEDESGHVHLTISVDAAQFRVTLTTETARTLATDLDFAARGAEDPDEVKHEL